jgi:hypothetical protein
VSVKTGGEGVAVESGGGVDVERGAETAVKLPVATASILIGLGYVGGVCGGGKPRT